MRARLSLGSGWRIDKARLLHPLNVPAQRDRLDLKEIRQPGLVYPLVHRQIGEDLPLRARQADFPRAVVEALAQEPCRVSDQKAKAVGLGPFQVCHAV